MVMCSFSVWVIAHLNLSLTSAHVCGEVTGCVLTAPEMDLGECTVHLPPQKTNKAELTLALKSIGDVTRNPKQDTSGPKKGHVSSQNFFSIVFVSSR